MQRLARGQRADLAAFLATLPQQRRATLCAGWGVRNLFALLTSRPQPRGLHAALGGRIGLVEGIIHHQDIRRALGRPRTIIPAEPLLTALRWAMPAPDIGGL